jgi:cephalosporin-C deacetylase-like acetyl esterase
MGRVNRRDFIKAAGAFASIAGPLPRGWAGNAPRSYGEDFPDMLPALLAKQLNALDAKWDAERAKIHTAADVEERNRFVREAVRKMTHGTPERNPLNAVVVRTHQRDGYRIENVMFESRPDFWVTGSLYVPTTGGGPFPGIIAPCGHYWQGRLDPEFQAAYQNLVKSGFVVLGYDPIGQGERRQFWDPETGRSAVPYPTYEHSLPGHVLLLMGQDLTHYRIWDGMRAIDYLLTRPEVDHSKIGCEGHSGGGTLTMYLGAVDERVQCVVINEGGTGHRWPVSAKFLRGGPSDVEQNVFPAAIYGIDRCDLHVAIAPRPLLALTENYSLPFERAADHIRRRYEQLGAADHFATGEATDPHAFTSKLRLTVTDWFCRWFYGRPGPSVEPEIRIEEPHAHYCTPTGSIRDARQGQTIFSLILKQGAALPPPRPVPSGGADLDAFRSRLAVEIRAQLRIGTTDQPLAPRLLVTTPRRGYRVEKVQFLSEPGVYIPAWVFLPDRKAPGRAIVYADEAGKEADGMEFGTLEQLARKGRTVIAVDLRGIGETALENPSDLNESPFSHLFNAETAAVYAAWYMDRCLSGMRVLDLIRSVDYALSRPDVDSSGVEMIGKGACAVWALYAAALDARIQALVAERGLISYASLTGVDRYRHSSGVFVRDVLKYFDLPQVAAAMAGRRLALLSPVDPMKEVSVPAARRAYDFARQTYAQAGAADLFQIRRSDEDLSAAEQYLSLLGGAPKLARM